MRATGAATSAAIVWSRPVVEKFGFPLPSRNGPHSGWPYAPQPARVACQLPELGPADRTARVAERVRHRCGHRDDERRERRRGRRRVRAVSPTSHPYARRAADPTWSIPAPTRPARDRVERCRASVPRARAAPPARRRSRCGRTRSRRPAIRAAREPLKCAAAPLSSAAVTGEAAMSTGTQLPGLARCTPGVGLV